MKMQGTISMRVISNEWKKKRLVDKISILMSIIF